MSDTDALERIKNRGTRPSVPARDVSLTIVPSVVTPEPSKVENTDTSTPRYQDNKSLEFIPPPDFETKPRSLRLEGAVLDRIQVACRTHGVSLDVIVEALFLQSEANPLVWDAVVEEAKRRNGIRKDIANQRRLASQVKKYSSG
jgi:hypothetical protein